MLEHDVEKKLVQGVKKLGGRCYKWVSPGNAGVPDRIVLLPGEQIIFIELKRDGNYPTELQKLQKRRIKKCGFEHHFVRGLNEVYQLLDYLERRVHGERPKITFSLDHLE